MRETARQNESVIYRISLQVCTRHSSHLICVAATTRCSFQARSLPDPPRAECSISPTSKVTSIVGSDMESLESAVGSPNPGLEIRYEWCGSKKLHWYNDVFSGRYSLRDCQRWRHLRDLPAATGPVARQISRIGGYHPLLGFIRWVPNTSPAACFRVTLMNVLKPNAEPCQPA